VPSRAIAAPLAPYMLCKRYSGHLKFCVMTYFIIQICLVNGSGVYWVSRSRSFLRLSAVPVCRNHACGY